MKHATGLSIKELDLRHYQRDLNLLDVVMSTPFDPYGSLRHLLLERNPPPYTVLTVFVVLVVLVAPSLVFQYLHGLTPLHSRPTYAIASTISISLVIFILVITLLLRLFAFQGSLRRSAAMCAYALTPLIPLALVYYTANYAIMGELTVLEYLSSGIPVTGDWLVHFFPYFVLIGVFWVFFLFAQAVRVLGLSSWVFAILLSVVCAIFLGIAGYIGVICTSAILPETQFIIKHFFTSLVASPGCAKSGGGC